jgi:hypothetical protein
MRADLWGNVVLPHTVQVEQSRQREHKHDERNHRRDDLKRNRARVRQQVMLLETVKQRPPKLACSPPDLKAVPDGANHPAGRRPGRCSSAPAHGPLTARNSQSSRALRGVSIGSPDQQAKPLQQRVGVDAFVKAPVDHGASDKHGALLQKGNKNIVHRVDRIALTGVTANVQSRIVETLDRVSRYTNCRPSSTFRSLPTTVWPAYRACRSPASTSIAASENVSVTSAAPPKPPRWTVGSRRTRGLGCSRHSRCRSLSSGRRTRCL